jgi:hypothetical protein
VVNIDQRTNFQGEKITSSSVGVRQRVVRAPDPKGVPHMPGFQTRTMLARIAPGPAGYELRTFECPKCDRVQRTLVVSDPMSGDVTGWLGGELKSPD